MKFHILSSVLLSALSGVVQAGSYDPDINEPVCARFSEITMNGNPVVADTVAGVNAPGDMSIATDYFGFRFFDFPFFNVRVNMDSVCIITNDPARPAPTCFYEVEMSFCRFYWFIKVPFEELEPIYVPRTDVISESKYDSTVEELFGNTPRRNLRSLNFLAEPEPDFPETDTVKAIEVTEEMKSFDENSKLLFDNLCQTRKRCFIWWKPFDCRRGGWTAHGSGPDPIEVTGGTDDFFGAFGQFNTPTNFNPITSSFGMELEMCYYRKEDPNFF